MKHLKCRILANKKIRQDIYRMRIEAPYLAREMESGQFVEVRCSGSLDPLLRRPLGLHRKTKDGIELLYEIVGKGTEMLSHRKVGEYADVIGPLGKGFTPQTANRKPQTAILIAGGIGVAPLVALAEELAYSVERIAYSVFIGAKTKKHILCEKDFKKLGAQLYTATDDGSKGYKGFITKLVEKELSAKRYPLNAKIYACGPTTMLKAVARIAKERKIRCQVSLEERMACGVGVCLGCPVKVFTQYPIPNTQYSYKMVCKDGPVFDAEDIAW